MLGLTTDILEDILRSQLDIEEAVMVRLNMNTMDDGYYLNQIICLAKINEIERQLKVIEEEDKNK